MIPKRTVDQSVRAHLESTSDSIRASAVVVLAIGVAAVIWDCARLGRRRVVAAFVASLESMRGVVAFTPCGRRMLA